MTNNVTEQHILKLAAACGIKFPSSRYNYTVIDNDDRTHQNVLARCVTFQDARDSAKDIFTRHPAANISIAGQGVGIIERCQNPQGTFACPICSNEIPHIHSHEDVAWLEQRRKLCAGYDSHMEDEIQRTVKLVDDNYPQDAKMRDSILAFAHAIQKELNMNNKLREEMDNNHDIVPTLRMFDGLVMGKAADEIDRLREHREYVDREIRRSRRFYFHTLKMPANTPLAQIFNNLLEANGTYEEDADKDEAREKLSRIPELKLALVPKNSFD